MMDYEIFKKLVEEQFLSYLPAEFKDFKVSTETTYKTNVTFDGLIVSPSVDRINKALPTVYVNYMYDDYMLSGDFRKTLQNAAEKWRVAYENVPEACTNFNFSDAEKKLVMELINTEQNREMLAEMPHREFYDLSIIYRFVSGRSATSVYSSMVSNSMADLMGMDEQQLYEAAFINTREMFPLQIKTMTEIMQEALISEGYLTGFEDSMIEESESWEVMYILTNKIKTFGAVSMLYEDKLQELAENIGTDLYILPSSIHEVIAVSTSSGSVEEMTNMVCEVNAEQVSPEERLSNHVYLYDKSLRKLVFAL